VRGEGGDDAGQAVLPLVLCLLFAMVVMASVVRWGVAARRAAEAQAAADAAALAVALTGIPEPLPSGAAEVSHVAGGRGRARVEVTVGGVAADATAVAVVTTTRRRNGLAPSLVAVLARAEELFGQPILVSSGYRSPDSQRRLWERRATNPYPVAPPGTSLHERGLAIDVPLHQVAGLAAVGPRAGLCHPLPEVDPVHFVVCPIPE
jgi:hypothetical protein